MAQELLPVTQADREAAADIWTTYCAKVGEVMVDRQMRNGGLDWGLPQFTARHRLASIAAAKERADKLETALREMIYEVTHLCPMRPDGSHQPIISATALASARQALSERAHD